MEMLRTLRRGLGRLAYFAPGGGSLRPLLHRWRGVQLGHNVWISQYVYLDELYPEGVKIGNDCTIGLRTSIIAHMHWGPRQGPGGFKPVVLEDGVFVGPHCVILPGVRIGAGAVIKAGSVVSRNVPPRVFWGVKGGEPLAVVNIPLTSAHSYEEFVGSLGPIGRKPKDVTAASSPQRSVDVFPDRIKAR